MDGTRIEPTKTPFFFPGQAPDPRPVSKHGPPRRRPRPHQVTTETLPRQKKTTNIITRVKLGPVILIQVSSHLSFRANFLAQLALPLPVVAWF